MVRVHECLIFLFGFNEVCMFYQTKPIFATRFLHILQVLASGFHTLISLLNSCKNLQFLIFWCTITHILGPRNLTDWILHGDLYFWSIVKVHFKWSTSYLCKEPSVKYVRKIFRKIFNFQVLKDKFWFRRAL